METLGKITFMIISLVISALVGGYVFLKLWLWFIVTTFGADPLTLVQAIGVGFFVGYIKTKMPKKKDGENLSASEMAERILSMIVFSILALGCGWVITLFQ